MPHISHETAPRDSKLDILLVDRDGVTYDKDLLLAAGCHVRAG